MKNTTKSIQAVELLETKNDSPINSIDAPNGDNCNWTKKSKRSNNGYRSASGSGSPSSFKTEAERRSFNAIISLRDIEDTEISTMEHKVCGIAGFIICILIIIIISYGELSHWEHNSYIMDNDNITKIYNTSFTVTCSWRSYHYTERYPIQQKYDRNFHNLCKNNIPHSCNFDECGKTWFALLFCTNILLLISSVILIYPKIDHHFPQIQNKMFCKILCKLWSLKYVKFILLFCGLLCFVSIIPITFAMNAENDICGDDDYNEFNKDTYNGIVENIDEPLWTLYLTPIIGLLLWLKACFISQIKTEPNIHV